MADDPDGGWGRLLTGLVAIALGLVFLFGGPRSSTGPRQFVLPVGRLFAVPFIAFGLYQVARGWGFDLSKWRARRKRRTRR